ncbi:GAMYB transcription factor [Trema orientale]|uniref:GAMYB transcription factor n=1 Tax=Trema orientale TaxID=63057 RepID=A0A2P5ENG7_TREOI|nr:GAMYB transcription factor [Trema orientale]
MFNGGVPDQLHQFIASSRPNSVVLPLSSSSSSSYPNSIDIHANYTHESHQLLPLQPHFLHPLLHQVHHKNNISHHDEHHKEEDATATAAAATAAANNLVSDVGLDMMESPRSIAELIPAVDLHHHHHPWSNDEVLALLRVRSTMDNWFPDVTWEHVSRKLAELGFKRSAEKCKEKFEEESSYFNNNNNNHNINNNCTKNYRLFHHHQLSELEQLYHGENQAQHHQNHNTMGAQKDQRVAENPSELDKRRGQSLEEVDLDSTRNETVVLVGGISTKDSDEAEKVVEVSKSGTNINKKRKRSSSSSHENNKMKFDMFKGFCEEIVKKMMAQQEEMHNKLLEDMVKRDQEKVAKEEAWKKQEMDRMNKELEIMAHEQAMAGDRQASIIDFLNKFTSNSADQTPKPKSTGKDISLTSSSSSSFVLQFQPHDHQQSPIITPTISHLEKNQTSKNNDNINTHDQQPSSSSKNPSTTYNIVSTPPAKPTPATSSSNKTQNPIPINNDKEDLGKRWPRDEVLALINLRCSFYSSGDQPDHHKEGILASSSVKAPLWERISQGMLELGYKRSAKRCKEKWENINKYFRKTKHVNKKRSVDSRTCPYFHQLSTLYNKGTTLVSSSLHHQQGQEISDHNISAMFPPETSQLIIRSDHPVLHDNDDDHHDHHNHDSSSHVVHVADQGERSGNNVIVHDHHQEVVPAGFDFEF